MAGWRDTRREEYEKKGRKKKECVSLCLSLFACTSDRGTTLKDIQKSRGVDRGIQSTKGKDIYIYRERERDRQRDEQMTRKIDKYRC